MKNSLAMIALATAFSANAKTQLPQVTNQAHPVQIQGVYMEAGQKSGDNTVYISAMASSPCHRPKSNEVVIHSKASSSGRLYYTVYDISRRVCKAIAQPTPYTIEIKNLVLNFTRVGGQFIRQVSISDHDASKLGPESINLVKATKYLTTSNVSALNVFSSSQFQGYANVIVSVRASNACELPQADQLYLLTESDKKGKLAYTLAHANQENCIGEFDPTVGAYSLPPVVVGSKFTNTNTKIELPSEDELVDNDQPVKFEVIEFKCRKTVNCFPGTNKKQSPYCSAAYVEWAAKNKCETFITH